MSKRKFFYLLGVFIVLSGLIGYNYMYKEHRNIAEENAHFKITSLTLIDEYNKDVTSATTKYLDKTVEILGTVSAIEQDNFTMNDVIVCYTDSLTIKQLIISKNVQVKGRSIGYDELLEYIKFDQITIINN